jgi:PAS domain S-box-containing protein
MEQQSQSKTKLLIAMFSLVFILIFLATTIIQAYYSKINSLIVLNEKITLSRNISNLIHSLQKERGLSSGYIVNDNGNFTKEMLQQRKITDTLIKELFQSFDSVNCKDLAIDALNIKRKMKRLSSIREEIDAYKYSTVEIITKYSHLNSLLLDMIINIAKTSHIPSITQSILAYSYLLYFKEYLGLERAEGVILLSKNQYDQENFIKFVNLMAIGKQNEVMFLKYASNSLQHYYLQHIKTKQLTEVEKIEAKILHNENKAYAIQPKAWYDLMTQKLNTIDKVSQYIENTTQKKIRKDLHNSKVFFIIIILLLIMSWLIFIYIMLHLVKLIKNEQRLRLVMDKYVISSMTNLKGIIIDVSQAFCDISGYTKEELIGRNHNVVRHPDMPKNTFAKLWEQLRKGESWSGKVKNRRKDGSSYWVYANIEPLYNENNEMESYISVRMDITENELLNQKIKEEEERNKLQEELMQQQHRLAQMGEMIAMIAHQWRQPLSAITAASGAIMFKASRDNLDADKAMELSKKIQEFSKHLSTTIDDFRNFFKSKKQKQKTNFKNIYESVLSIMEDDLIYNNIHIECFCDKMTDFISYENELKQVLLNLIKNSEDALKEKSGKDKKIKVVIEGRQLAVYDNAGGIDEEILPKIFDPYFSTKTKKDGTGLGLYMSKVIVEDHCGGVLTVDNTIDGVKFEIILGDDDA